MNKALERIFPAAALAALSACAVGPDFERPSVPLAPGYEIPDASQKDFQEAGQDDISKWWTRFGDPLLSSFIERAFERNFDMAIARASLDSARAALGVSQSGLFPALDGNAAMTESGKGNTGTRPTYSLGLSSKWEIDVFGGTRRAVEASLADYMASSADRCAVKIAVAAEVANAYYLYRAACQDLKITLENLDVQRKTYAVVEKKWRSQISAKLDLVRSAAQMQAVEAQIPTLEAERDKARYALELLLGLELGALKGELEEYRPLPDIEAFAPLSVPASLISRRPDIMALEYRLASATANIGAAEADFYPRFYISGSISYSAPNVGDIFKSPYGSWSVGPSASWNIFSAGKTYYNVKAKEALARKAAAQWEQAVMTAVKETQDYVISCAKGRENVELLSQAVESNRSAYKYSYDLYSVGKLPFLDLLDVQRTMLAAEQSLVSSRKRIISDVIGLYKSLGGGWTQEDMRDEEYEADIFLLF